MDSMPQQAGKKSMVLAAIAAFCVYTCMYAYRKPFTVGTYAGTFLHIDYKIWLVVAQSVGYTLSKFLGVKFIAELKPKNRLWFLIGCIVVAWLALLLFAVIPAPYSILFLLINGLPLGVVYGIVFSYLEGRQSTEVLGAVLAASFIFASGFVQSVGKYVLDVWLISESWMPFITGLIFFIPLLIFSVLLNKTPAPSAVDIATRTARNTMSRAERKSFVSYFAPGLAALVIIYIMLTILRDYRSNFASNIWSELGYGNAKSVYAISELLPSLLVLAIMSSLIMVRNNFTALLLNHWLIIAGFFTTVIATLLFSYGLMNGFWWVTLTGLGLYIGYVPFNCMLFERLIAAFKYVSTAGFIIYVADSFGYAGSSIILIIKNFNKLNISWTGFFIHLIYITAVIGIALTILSMIYFYKKYHGNKALVKQTSA